MAMSMQELRKRQRNIELELKQIEREYDNVRRTNHILHPAITIFVLNLWGLVWVIGTYLNSQKRDTYEKLMDESERILYDMEESMETAVTS